MPPAAAAMHDMKANAIHAESERLRIGDCMVDVACREVTSTDGGAPRRLTVKALHVLLVLAEQHGRVVSRDALLERVWPDTAPTDDVLTQAVAQLRRVFGDDRDAPRYVETIAKGGYRLLAEVQWLPRQAPAIPEAAAADAAAAMAPAATSPRPLPRTRWRPVALLLAVGAVIAAVLFRSAGERAPAVADAGATPTVPSLAYTAITSRPGRETSPNLSPDGAMVAYVEAPPGRSNRAVMVQTTAQVAPQQLTHPGENSADYLPVWSRDGRWLAFVRVTEPDTCHIMLIAASGGEERKAGDCYGGSFHSYDWTPDGRGLLMGGTKNGEDSKAPLRRFDVASGRWQALSYPISDGDIDLNPHYSPDGQWLVFRRAYSLSDLWMMPAGGGAPRRLTRLRGDIRGWDWLPDGSGLVFTLVGSDDGMYRYELATGAIAPLGLRAPASLPDIAARASAMVFEIDQMRTGLFRYTLTADGARAQRSAQLFASSGSDLLPALSPDGRTLAFVSDRSAQLQLWLGELARPEHLRAVEGLTPVARHTPVWSDDGRRLLVLGVDGGTQRLYEVEADSGAARVLPVPAETPVYAAYAGSPQRMLVGSDGGEGRLRLTLYDTSTAVWRELAAIEDVALAKFDARGGAVFFTRASRPGLWRSDAALRRASLIEPDGPPPMAYRHWAISGGEVRVLTQTDRCAMAWAKLPLRDRDADCLDRERPTPIGMPGVGDGGRSVYVAMPVADNVDIGWAMLPESASGSDAGDNAPSP